MAIDFRRDLLIDWPEAPAGAVKVKADDLKAPGLDVRQGLWPGIRRPPNVAGRGDETVSASVEPWVDANGYLAACSRALAPGKTALIVSKPESEDRVVPYDSLELALIEARVGGANAVLHPDRRFREDFLAGKAEAVAAWKRLLDTAAWLREQDALLGRPNLPAITMLVEPGENETIELANLLFRRNASPDVRTIDTLPAPSKDRVVIVAAGLRKLTRQGAAKLVAHARAGAAVITDNAAANAWWRGSAAKPARSQQDRDYYTLGQGSLIAYKEAVADPSEFALDVIDVAGHPRRAVRLWNAPAVIAVASPVLHMVNYGSPIDQEVQTRVQGHFQRATLLAPGEKARTLAVAKRGPTTEVMIPFLRRLATVIFG